MSCRQARVNQNVRMVHVTRAERAGSVQRWREQGLRTRLPFVVGHHNGHSMEDTCAKGQCAQISTRACLCSSNRALGGRYCGRT